MSMSTSKSGSELLGGSTFSYAQAAKGRSPSVPNNALEPGPEKPAAKRTASEGRATVVDDFKSQKNVGTAAPAKSEETKASTRTNSGPPSPERDTISTAVVSKEEDPLTTQNASTWEKQSQSSQAKDGDSEKRESDTASWADDTPAQASLRDAPPPAVNFWEQRKGLLQAKAKAVTPAPSPSSQVSDYNPSSDAANGSNVLGGSNEARKLDKPRKTKGNPSSPERVSVPNGIKEWSRAAESKLKNGDEGATKNNSKAVRTSEVSKPTAPASVPLPPPGDAVSWPTPDTAQDEEKKRSQERAEKAEKEKTTASKPNSKKEWTTMPFVPSAVFTTPIPQSRRGGGGRPSRGGREASTGRGGNMLPSGNGVEKPTPGTQNNVAGQPPGASNDRSRAEPNVAKTSAPGPKPKRSASAGPPMAREQRKGGDTTSNERRKEEESKPSRSNAQNASNTSAAAEPNGISASTQTGNERKVDPTAIYMPGEESSWNGKTLRDAPERGERRPSGPPDTHAHPKSGIAEKRNDIPARQIDHTRDFHGASSMRERNEGQRGRGGGLRSRNSGAHPVATPAFTNGQGFVNGQTSHHHHPAMGPTKSHSNHERHLSQSQGVSYMQPQPHSRSYRSASRSQSIPHPGSPYSRYPAAPYTGPPNLPNIQTDVANSYGYQPGHQGIMSAMPFTSFPEQAAITVYSMVSMQMEYYFSVDNLCKDLFLRKNMDSQGYVFLSVLVKFNRMKQLTQDIELIRWVCLHSNNIEIRTGADGIDRLRTRDGWEQWVLAKEERDPSAQNDGPDQVERPRVPQPPMLGMPYGYDGVSEGVVPYSPHQNIDENPNSQAPNGTAPPFVPAAVGPVTNGNISETPVTQTPLSAVVPDFAPSIPMTNGHSLSPLDSSTQNTNLFTDEQVESLMIVVGKPINPSAPLPPFASASSRTFSNGSIDGRTFNDEFTRVEERPSRSKVNGNVVSGLDELKMIQRSRSPYKVGSPKRQGNSHASPVFWVKDKETPIDSLPNELTHESYHLFRTNALHQREQSGTGKCHRDMDILYQFWSHFLIRNFNRRMYEEFRRMAFDDVNTRNSNVGLKNLVQYYDESMLGQKVISDEIARDFVNLVNSESAGKERPAFDKLRAAWRNGATNMKNRKKSITSSTQI